MCIATPSSFYHSKLDSVFNIVQIMRVSEINTSLKRHLVLPDLLRGIPGYCHSFPYTCSLRQTGMTGGKIIKMQVNWNHQEIAKFCKQPI